MTPREIFLHHSLTADGKEVSWGAIRHYHMTAPEYRMKDIGYHSGIELVRSGEHLHYEVLLGRPFDEMGAHARGHNAESIGILFVGNYDITVPPDDMLLVGARHVRWLMRTYDIPIVNVRRHSEVAQKTCPGRLFPWADFLEMVRFNYV